MMFSVTVFSVRTKYHNENLILNIATMHRELSTTILAVA